MYIYVCVCVYVKREREGGGGREKQKLDTYLSHNFCSFFLRIFAEPYMNTINFVFSSIILDTAFVAFQLFLVHHPCEHVSFLP